MRSGSTGAPGSGDPRDPRAGAQPLPAQRVRGELPTERMPRLAGRADMAAACRAFVQRSDSVGLNVFDVRDLGAAMLGIVGAPISSQCDV